MRHPVLLCLLPPHLMRVSLALFVHYPRISCGYLSPSLFITSDIPCGHHFDTILCHFLFLLTLKCKKSVKTLPFHLFYLHSPKIFRIFAPWIHAGGLRIFRLGFADILKRRLLRFVLTSEMSQFQPCSGLSNGRCPTGYRLILLVPIGGTSFAYMCMRARVP